MARFSWPPPMRQSVAAQARLRRLSRSVLTIAAITLTVAASQIGLWLPLQFSLVLTSAWQRHGRLKIDTTRLRAADMEVSEAEALLIEDANADDGEGAYARRMRVHDLEVGQELVGIVQSIQSYGFFVDVGADTDGLVHISRVQEGFVDNLDDIVQPGQEVTVWVSSVSEDGRLGLSMCKSRLPGASVERPPRGPKFDLEAFSNFDPSEWLTAKVVGITDFGAFVELAPSENASGGDPVQGLVHITQLAVGRVEKTSDVVALNQEVKARIISVDVFNGRLSFSMIEPEAEPTYGDKRPPKPDVSAFDGVPPTEWFIGKVHHTATFGIFVDVVPPSGGSPIQGLVHVTQIKDAFVDDPASEVEVGQDIRVRVVRVDTFTGRLAFSMRQA